MICASLDRSDLERIRAEGEYVFEREYQAVLPHVKAKHPAMHSSKQREIARRIAKRATDQYLQENYGLTMADIEAKLMVLELDVSLEDLAT